MALLPYVKDEDAAPEVLELFNQQKSVANLSRIFAHSPKIYKYRDQLSYAFFTEAALDPKLREIMILRTAKDCHSLYEWVQHLPAARQVGVTEEQIAAIESWSGATCFNALERLVLQLTDEVHAKVKGSREVVEGLKKYLSPAEIIELLIMIGHWRQVASILETLEIELDEFAGRINLLEGRIKARGKQGRSGGR